LIKGLKLLVWTSQKNVLSLQSLIIRK
jgi:hypothetical protein